MAEGHGAEHLRELDETPTWAVASVCAVIILISILLEKGLHHLGEWFTERHKKAMFEALEKIKGDPARIRFSHETSFVRQHSSIWNRVPFIFYIVSFFRQFFRSVRKADYLAMRHGFITVHLAPGSKFDFQKYIKRSLEDDFKVIVGISPLLWFSAVMFLLLNVKGWHTLFWIAVIPLITILSVGTKLQAIITQMALEIKERHAVIQGIPIVQLSDHHFWFGRPRFILFLIHFTLFQNAFQLIYFLWIWYEFGLNSCFNDSSKVMIARLCLGLVPYADSFPIVSVIYDRIILSSCNWKKKTKHMMNFLK
ncbi:hypothetical protein ZIOFF_031973 [Zingiber officinale]|uniref:MLO-like protein n=1 Tax=Zingiber officinale TaxID=94328 RepID=A0A8J5LB95_ZINOF|nr:hypothetical protein ZIOFF_035560 [Zingiber officinale]KAG6506646.1 hypothetical protein ZIOFF_031973 [Zingiber officinale]